MNDALYKHNNIISVIRVRNGISRNNVKRFSSVDGNDPCPRGFSITMFTYIVSNILTAAAAAAEYG